MGIGDIISQATNKLTFKLNEATYDKDAEKAALQSKLQTQKAEIEKQAAEKSGTATPVEAKKALIAAIYKAYIDYVKEWQRRAAASRQFPQKFVESFGYLSLGVDKYKKELDANPSKELFERIINELTGAIKSIYVEGKYKGDLNLLAIEIERSKPSFPGAPALLEKIKPPPKTAVQKFSSSFFSTLVGILAIAAIFFLCILSGSLAANDAIGRSPAIRAVYFIYAAVPFFTPFVLIYYIWRYWKGTYPIFYNMLPLTNHISQYWIVNTLLWPFFFYKDSNVDVQAEQFVRLGKALVWTSAPSGGNAAANTPNSNNNVAAAAAANTPNSNNNVAAAAAAANNDPSTINRQNTPNSQNNTVNNPKPLTDEQNDKVIDAVFNNKTGPKPPVSNN